MKNSPARSQDTERTHSRGGASSVPDSWREGPHAAGGGFNRRSLLRASTLMGGGGLIAQAALGSRASAHQIATGGAGRGKATLPTGIFW